MVDLEELGDDSQISQQPQRLCGEFQGYRGDAPYSDVLLPWIPRLQRVLAALQPYRALNTQGHPYPVTSEALCCWYALSRFNELVLKGFESSPDFYQGIPQRETWRGSVVALDEYVVFFEALGFAAFLTEGGLAPEPFQPFFHEIVEVVEDPLWSGEPVTEHAYWPGLMFGQMLFSRAGVRVRCRPGDLNKTVAETSRLHFTYWRLRRVTEDLSHGWGHNSQWSTHFRRDYDTGDAFHFNVDGRHPLGDEGAYRASFTPGDWKREERYPDGLTMQERIELLIHRSFVRSVKSDGEGLPYDHRYSPLKPEKANRAG
ncbi:MAG: hypothetical protein H7Z41_03960 [Cytophagales bacterium]|nr:hypothetical protein [Armatimonadota bacterium]